MPRRRSVLWPANTPIAAPTASRQITSGTMTLSDGPLDEAGLAARAASPAAWPSPEPPEPDRPLGAAAATCLRLRRETPGTAEEEPKLFSERMAILLRAGSPAASLGPPLPRGAASLRAWSSGSS
jgi:hypothetical protein